MTDEEREAIWANVAKDAVFKALEQAATRVDAARRALASLDRSFGTLQEGLRRLSLHRLEQHVAGTSSVRDQELLDLLESLKSLKRIDPQIVELETLAECFDCLDASRSKGVT